MLRLSSSLSSFCVLCGLLLPLINAQASLAGTGELCLSTGQSSWRWEHPVSGGEIGNQVRWIPERSEFVAMGDAVQTSADGESWLAGHRFAPLSVRDFVWTGSEFYAAVADSLGVGGAVLRSSDLVNWSTVLNGINAPYGIAWDGTQVLTVGYQSEIWSSTDGVTWSEIDSGLGSSSSLLAVIWAGGQFVAVGTQSAIWTSPDGLSWTAQTAPVSGRQLGGIVWTGTEYVLANFSRDLWTSPDGIDWDVLNLASTGLSATNVILTDGRLYALTGGTEPTIYQADADDLSLWSRELAAGDVRSVASNGVETVAVGIGGWRHREIPALEWFPGADPGHDPRASTAMQDVALVGTSSGELRRSTDNGQTWDLVLSGEGGIYEMAGNGSSASPLFLVETGSTYRSSPDGETWTARGSASGHSGRLQGLEGRFFVKDFHGLLTSVDGATWSYALLEGGGTGANFFAITKSGSHWIAVGAAGAIRVTDQDPSTWPAVGATWTTVTAPTSSTLLGVVTAHGRVYAYSQVGEFFVSEDDGLTWNATSAPGSVLVLSSNGSQLLMYARVGSAGNAVFSSTDGETWTPKALPPSGGVDDLSWDGDSWIAIGNEAAYSGPGTAFAPVGPRATGWALWSVASIGQVAVAVGPFGTLLRIDYAGDAVWERIPVSGDPSLLVVEANDSLFVAVGGGGAILTSTDGLTWTNRNPGGTRTRDDVTHGDLGFVAVSRGDIFHSPDGISWTEQESNSGAFLTDVDWTADRYVARGLDGEVVTSLDGVFWQEEPQPIAFYSGGASVAQRGPLTLMGGGFGLLWSSTDAGRSWGLLDIGGGLLSSAYQTLELIGSEIVASRGAELWTTLDGETWTTSPHLSGASHSDLVTVLDENLEERALLVGRNGLIQSAPVARHCPVIPGTEPEVPLFADGFESGDLAAWLGS